MILWYNKIRYTTKLAFGRSGGNEREKIDKDTFSVVRGFTGSSMVYIQCRCDGILLGLLFPGLVFCPTHYHCSLFIRCGTKQALSNHYRIMRYCGSCNCHNCSGTMAGSMQYYLRLSLERWVIYSITVLLDSRSIILIIFHRISVWFVEKSASITSGLAGCSMLSWTTKSFPSERQSDGKLFLLQGMVSLCCIRTVYLR